MEATIEVSEAVAVFTAAIEVKDGYTGSHVQRVARLAAVLARELDLGEELVRDAELAGLLHDLGKIWVDDKVLQKGGALEPSEWEQMRRHPHFGWSMLLPATEEPWCRIARALLLHHERPDGLGYPFGFRGEEVPLLARIIAVADTFDAMTSDRPYRRALAASAAYDEIRRFRGTQFCERVVDAFSRAYEGGRLVDPRGEQP